MVVKAGYRQERVLTYREQHVCILGLTTGRDSAPLAFFCPPSSFTGQHYRHCGSTAWPTYYAKPPFV